MLKTLNKKILTTTLALVMTIPAFASIGVSPTRIEINANKLKTNYVTTAIDVKGSPNASTRYKVYTGYFKVNENNEAVMIDHSNGDIYDLSKKVRFVPSEFSIPQGKSQKVRVNVAGLKQLPAGESRAMIYIEDVNPKEMALPTYREGIGAQIIVKTRAGIPLYIDNGRINRVGEIEKFEVVKAKDGLYAETKILSKGNTRIRCNRTIQISQGKKLIDEFSIGEKVVSGGGYNISKDKIRIDNIPNSGEYTVTLVVSYADENGKRKNIKKEINVNIQGKV